MVDLPRRRRQECRYTPVRPLETPPVLTPSSDPVIYDDADPAAYEVPIRPAFDPWAHRRGEPRLFAFLWTLYLFITVLGSLLWLTRSGVLAASAYGPAARIMLIVIAAGATILWPMVRFSQIAPATRPLSAAFNDLVVIVMPVQVVVWPLAFLANWPVKVVAVLAGMLFVWPALTGGLVATAFALARRREVPILSAPARITWMLVCIGASCAGPLVVVLTGVGEKIDLANWAWKLSPFTLVFLLTGTGLRGPHAPVGVQDWLSLAPVAGAALLVWLFAACTAARPLPDRGGAAEDHSDGAGQGGTPDPGGRGPATRLDSQTNN
jgi:hypothetical protein